MKPVIIFSATARLWLILPLRIFYWRDQSYHERVTCSCDSWTAIFLLQLYLWDRIASDTGGFISLHCLLQFVDLAQSYSPVLTSMTLLYAGSVRTLSNGCCSVLSDNLLGAIWLLVLVSHIPSWNTPSLFLIFLYTWEAPFSTVTWVVVVSFRCTLCACLIIQPWYPFISVYNFFQYFNIFKFLKIKKTDNQYSLQNLPVQMMQILWCRFTMDCRTKCMLTP